MHRTTLLGMLALATAAVALPSASSQQQTPEPGSASSISNLKNNIKNVVWLIMENRSFDNLLGGQKHEGLENPIQNGPYCNPYNVSKTCLGKACSQARDYDSVKNDPSHAVSGNTMEFYSTWTPDNAAIADGTLKANNLGFITEQYHNYGSKVNITELAIQVMNYYTEDQVPVMTSLVQNFLTFNHWHSDVAGVSTWLYKLVGALELTLYSLLIPTVWLLRLVARTAMVPTLVRTTRINLTSRQSLRQWVRRT